MRILFFILVCFCYSFANAGYFVEKSMYSPNYILVGKGNTPEQAYKDALAAMPKEKNRVVYEIDLKNSAANQCMEGGIPDQKLESCGMVAWQTQIPLIRIER
jgi:hypothetical protein